jgi:hypothetical protein
MLFTTKLGIVLLMATSLAGTCFSQQEAPKPASIEQQRFFQLSFVVKEVEQGKVINSRAYSMMVSAEGPPPFLPAASASIRNGSKVPVTMSPGSIQYIEVGVNIDCRGVKDLQNRLALVVTADISRAAQPASPGTLLHNTKWTSGVVVPIGKPTVIFASDDPTTKLQLQLELTATPIK